MQYNAYLDAHSGLHLSSVIVHYAVMGGHIYVLTEYLLSADLFEWL
jgi:hypothetical protein